jgi:hypothetical protein
MLAHQICSLSAIEDDAVTFGVMTIAIDPTDNTKAVAVGKFERNTRTTRLTKLPSP